VKVAFFTGSDSRLARGLGVRLGLVFGHGFARWG
jgi:hypothetical protein